MQDFPQPPVPQPRPVPGKRGKSWLQTQTLWRHHPTATLGSLPCKMGYEARCFFWALLHSLKETKKLLPPYYFFKEKRFYNILTAREIYSRRNACALKKKDEGPSEGCRNQYSLPPL